MIAFEEMAQDLTARGAALRAEIAQLERQLDVALAAGEPTGPIREFLKAAEDELSTIVSEADSLGAAHLESHHRAIDATARELAAQASARVAAATADLAIADLKTSKIEGPILANDDVATAAQQVAAADAELAKSSASLTRSQATCDGLIQRIAALEEKRAAIRERRAQGKTEPADASAVELLALDLEGLHRLREQAELALAPLLAARQVAISMLAGAREELRMAEARATESALVVHAEALSDRLLETIERIQSAASACGRSAGRPAWAPSAKLSAALRRMELIGPRR